RTLLAYWSVSGRLTERIAIVGATDLALRLKAGLTRPAAASAGIASHSVVGMFDDPLPGDEPEIAPFYSRSMNDLVDLIRSDRVDTVIMAVPMAEETRFYALYDRLRDTAVNIRLCPDRLGLKLGIFDVSRCGHDTFLNVADRPLDDWRG